MPNAPVDLNTLDLPDLFDALVPDDHLASWLDLVRREDLGDVGDVTTAAVTDPGRTCQAAIVSRESGIIAGLVMIEPMLHAYGFNDLQVTMHTADGDPVNATEAVATLRGPLAQILVVERPLLNVIGRLSGIATRTRAYVDAIRGCKAVILDTRKTMPGMRGLEKYAVRCGGGHCHRVGLHDAILVKDNHLAGVPAKDVGPFLRERLEVAQRSRPLRFIEVEVDSLEQFDSILATPPGLIDIVLLDNMDPSELADAVQRRDASTHDALLLEASGGVNLDTVRSIAESGVDRISVGAITHSATWFDVGLDMS